MEGELVEQGRNKVELPWLKKVCTPGLDSPPKNPKSATL